MDFLYSTTNIVQGGATIMDSAKFTFAGTTNGGTSTTNLANYNLISSSGAPSNKNKVAAMAALV